MAFMQPQVYKGGYFKVNTSVGTEIVPADLVGATGGTVAVESLRYYLEGEPDDENEVEGMETGWLARMSAPGYLDCTAWSAYPTEAAAWAALHEMFEPDDTPDDTPTAPNCDDWGTGEGRYHGRM